MNKKKDLKIVALTMNLAIIVFEIIGFIIIFKNLGFIALEYYTQDSNLLLLLSSIILSVYLILDLKGKKKSLPKWFTALRLCSVLSTTLTFFVVLFILTPEFDNGLVGAFLDGSMKYHHLLCPILALISYVFYEKYNMKPKDNILALVFTIIYSIVLMTLNFTKVVAGPYPFFKVYENGVLSTFGVGLLILACALVLSYGLVILNKKLCVKKVETLK